MQQHSQHNRQLDFAALREQISIQQVLELLRFVPSESKGDQLRGPCPIHGSTRPQSRSLSVNVSKNAFQCFGCGKKGNQLDLAAECFGLPLYQTAIKLCEDVGISPPRK